MNKFSNKTIMIINLMKIITVSDEAWNASVLFWHTNWNVIWHTESNDYVSWDFFHVFECKNGCPKELDFKNNWGPEYTGEFFANKKQWKFCKWSNNLSHSDSFFLVKKLVNKLTDIPNWCTVVKTLILVSILKMLSWPAVLNCIGIGKSVCKEISYIAKIYADTRWGYH